MIVGLIIALVGAFGGLIGALSMPWIDSDAVQFQDAATNWYSGFAWPTGIIAMVLIAACAALLVVALVVPHRRKLMATITMALSFAVLVFTFLTPFYVRSAIVAAIEQNAMRAETQLAMFYGYHFLFFGLMVMGFGCAWVLGSVGSYKTSDKLLRVAHLWHGKIVRDQTFTERHNIRIGGDADCDFVVPLTSDPESSESVTLFKIQPNEGYSVTLKGMKGRVNIGHTLMSPEDAVKKAGGSEDVTIEKGDWGTIDFGFNQIFFNYVHPDVVVGRGGAFKTHEGTFVAALVASAFFAIGLWITSQFAWDPAGSIERHELDRRVMQVDAAVGQEAEEVLLDLGEEEDDDTGKRAEGEEGKFGDPDNDPDQDNQVPRRDGAMADRIDVKNIGLADLLSNKMGQGGAISSILSDNTAQFENAMAVAMAGTGSELVVGYGAGGMGFRGTGSGGGGTGGYGRIHGLGNVDTGGGMGTRVGIGHKGARRVGNVTVSNGNSTGFCQKGNIEAVVKQRAGAIRACYEQQLQLHEGLSGKVQVRWTINADGKVEAASVTNSTIGNSSVDNCIMMVIRRMRFQKPEGGICVVQWPFVFSPG